MAYKCPDCGRPVEHQLISESHNLLTRTIANIFSGYHCPRCGKIPLRDFPPDVQKAMWLAKVPLIVGAVALFVVIVIIKVLLRSSAGS